MKNVFESMIEIFEEKDIKRESKIKDKSNKNNQYSNMMDIMKQIKG